MTTKLKDDLRSYFKDKDLFQSKYYLKESGKNTFLGGIPQTFYKMFKNGNGGELEDKNGTPAKAAAIHSSSMLAYNFFSWINEDNPFVYEDVKYDKVVFEEQLRVLKTGTSDGKKFPKSNAKANMDVVLAGRNAEGKISLLFIESKFTEHLSNARADLTQMVLSYSTPQCYFEKGREWADLVESWKKKAKDNSNKGYFSGIKQDICHLISISNLMNGHTRDWFNKEGAGGKGYGSWLKQVYGLTLVGDEEMKFRNIVFSPSERYKGDFQDMKNYRNLYEVFEREVKDIIPSSLKIGLITYTDLWQAMEPSIKDEKLRDYLQERYVNYQV